MLVLFCSIFPTNIHKDVLYQNTASYSLLQSPTAYGKQSRLSNLKLDLNNLLFLFHNHSSMYVPTIIPRFLPSFYIFLMSIVPAKTGYLPATENHFSDIWGMQTCTGSISLNLLQAETLFPHMRHISCFSHRKVVKESEVSQK